MHDPNSLLGHLSVREYLKSPITPSVFHLLINTFLYVLKYNTVDDTSFYYRRIISLTDPHLQCLLYCKFDFNAPFTLNPTEVIEYYSERPLLGIRL